jgi:hypothetical protein
MNAFDIAKRKKRAMLRKYSYSSYATGIALIALGIYIERVEDYQLFIWIIDYR